MEKLVVIAGLIWMTESPSAFALGFLTPDQNARATGQGEAFTAQADDASAIYYNPGGLTQIRGTEVMAGVYTWLPSFRFRGALSNEEMNTPACMPHFYAASDFGLKDWRLGVGINNAFGTAMDWGDGSSFRYLVTEADLSVLAISPTIAYQFNEHLSTGVGLNVYHGELLWDRRVSFAPLPVGDGDFKLEGDGWALGATAGLLWKINDQNSVGLTYRSPFSMDFKGDARIESAPLGLPINPGPSDINASMEFPQMVVVGYAFRPIKELKLEADIEWVNWDTLNNVKIHSSNPVFDAATAQSATLPFQWKDTFSYKFGAEYRINEEWTVRAGYCYWQNSVPEATFSPLLPDSAMHSFACGVGYSATQWGADLGYQYCLWDGRTVHDSVNSPFVDGKWEPQSHAIILTTWLRL